MELSFTSEEFFTMFAQYNQAIWPAQVGAYLLGLSAILLVINEVPHTDRLISGILALLWLWNGLVFQLFHFREINGVPAVFFGVLMIWQAILFAGVGVVQNRLHFAASLEPSRLVGTLFIFYALYLYPVLGSLAGHGYPFSPLFGVAPCPTTLFTFGLLLWTEPRIPRNLLIIPFIWSVFSIDVALSLGMVEDFALPIAALIGTILLVRRDRPLTLKHGSSQHHTVDVGLSLFAAGPGERYYGYVWWGFGRAGGDYDFTAARDKGQYIYVSLAKRLVIVRHGIAYGIPSSEWMKLFYEFVNRY